MSAHLEEMLEGDVYTHAMVAGVSGLLGNWKHFLLQQRQQLQPYIGRRSAQDGKPGEPTDGSAAGSARHQQLVCTPGAACLPVAS